MTTSPADQFLCFYCGEWRPQAESSDEHIVPECMGGSRNVTLTDRVCKECNGFMGKNVDAHLCRDWFIQRERSKLKIKNKGKQPPWFLSRLVWHRPEAVHVYVLPAGTWLFRITGTPDGQPRMMIRVHSPDPAEADEARRTWARDFSDCRVLPDPAGMSDYEVALLSDFKATTSAQMEFRFEIKLDAWNRGLAKIGLGLACLTFGNEYVLTEEANMLRAFARENDAIKRQTIPLRGTGGYAWDAEPRITQLWEVGEGQHLLLLLAVGSGVLFVWNIFGQWETTVAVALTDKFNDRLADNLGLARLVDARAKKTTGPMSPARLPLKGAGK